MGYDVPGETISPSTKEFCFHNEEIPIPSVGNRAFANQPIKQEGVAMKKILFVVLLSMTFADLRLPGKARAQAGEEGLVLSCIQVLEEIMAIPEQAIPPALLANARGIAIFPGMVKAGFIIGGRYGTGITVVRRADGNWSNPVFYRTFGGSIGLQAGAQSTDVILVFKTPRSLDHISLGKFTLGGNVSVAAGPVGRHAEASTDDQLGAEIYSYSRSRGLFAGVSLTGSSIQVDYQATSAFYGTAGLLPMDIFARDNPNAPPIVEDLKQAVARYSGS